MVVMRSQIGPLQSIYFAQISKYYSFHIRGDCMHSKLMKKTIQALTISLLLAGAIYGATSSSVIAEAEAEGDSGFIVAALEQEEGDTGF